MMRFAIIEDGSGIVRSILTAADIATLAINIPNGCDAIPCSDLTVFPGAAAWVDGRFVPVVIQQPLSEVRLDAWERVKAARDWAEAWGCSTPLGRADSDPGSQRKLAGAVQMAMIAQASGAPFAIAWTMQNNASVEHDAQAMILLGVAVGQHVAACHAVALAKRAAIEAADTAAALAAIDVEAGWPDAPAA